jgi:hypothetical protein
MSFLSNVLRAYGICITGIGVFIINDTLRDIKNELIIVNKSNNNYKK